MPYYPTECLLRRFDYLVSIIFDTVLSNLYEDRNKKIFEEVKMKNTYIILHVSDF